MRIREAQPDDSDQIGNVDVQAFMNSGWGAAQGHT